MHGGGFLPGRVEGVGPELFGEADQVLRRLPEGTFERVLAALLRMRDAREGDEQPLRSAARELAPIAALTDDDWVLFTALAKGLRQVKPPPQSLQHLVCLARWGALRMPSIQVSGVQAAALMLSDLSDEQLDELAPPFRAFQITLQEPLVVEERLAGRVEVLVWRSRFGAMIPKLDDGSWTLWVAVGHGSAMALGPSALGPLYHEQPLLPFDHEHVWQEGMAPLDSAQTRALTLLMRLTLNVCAALQEQDGGALATLRRRTRRRKGDKRRRVRSLEARSDYDFGFDATVDMREHIADYVSGDIKRVYKVRWVVRGHMRNQPYGPERSLRRRIWIAPYWKGPEGAPISKREKH